LPNHPAWHRPLLWIEAAACPPAAVPSAGGWRFHWEGSCVSWIERKSCAQVSRNQYDLAVAVALHDQFMRFGGISQRKILLQDRHERAISQACAQGGVDFRQFFLARGHQGHAANVGVAPHRITWVDLDRAA